MSSASLALMGGGGIESQMRSFGKRTDGRPVGKWTQGIVASPSRAHVANPSRAASVDHYCYVQPSDGDSTDAPVYLMGKQLSASEIRPPADSQDMWAPLSQGF